MVAGQVVIRTEEEIDLIRESSLLVGKTLGEVSKLVAPGANTLKLDTIAEEFIRDNGGIPAFKDYGGTPETGSFPFTLCVSINEEVVHGMPNKNKFLKEGDIVAIDCGVLKNGYFGDCAYTFEVGDVSPKKSRLLKVTKESLYLGLKMAVEGGWLGDISQSIQSHVETHGYSVVREMVGHGIGTELHAPPEIPNYGRRKTGLRLLSGMVFAIEPMVNLGKRRIKTLADGWTISTSDGLASAHFEHTIVVRAGKCEILSSHDFILNQ
jgi:methionyl aminopeptidase